MQDQDLDSGSDGRRKRVNPIGRLGMGWLEWMILGLAALGIAAAILSIEYTSDELRRQSNRALIGAEMRHAIVSSHLWFEEAYDGDSSINVETDVFGNIEYASSLAWLLLQGGDTGTTVVDPVMDAELRAYISEIDAELTAYRELIETRWAERSTDGSPSVTDEELDTAFRHILGIFVEGQARFEELSEAGERQLRWIGFSVVVFLCLLVCVIVFASNRSRRRIRAQNASLRQQAAELMTSQTRLEDAQRLARLGYIEWEQSPEKAWWWSEEVYRIYGFEPGEIVPTPELMRQMVHPDDLESVERIIGETTHSGSSQLLSYRIIRHDGEVRSLNGRILMIPAQDDQPSRLVGTLQDVTDQKRVEEELRRHRASLTAGQQIARLGTWDLDIETNKAWWSEEVYRVIGLEPGAVEPCLDRFLEAVLPDDRQHALEAIDTIVATGEPMSIELRLPKPDGAVCTTQVAAAIFHDDNGQPVRLIGAIQDITERKQIEEELRRNRATLTAGQKLARLGTWEWDLTTNGAWLSDETYTIMGIDQDGDLPSFEQFMSAFEPEDRAAVMGTIHNAIVEHQAYDMELRFRVADGSLRVAHARGEPYYDDDGRPVRLIGAIQDITERKRIEEELAVARDQAVEASRLKSEFLATMSHEIRTPMNGVFGMLDLLLDTGLSRQQKELVDSARESAGSLLTIINDILDFSRIEAGRLLLDRSDFELTPVVESAAEILAGNARDQNNSLMSYVDPAIPSVLQGDPDRLRQVLVNLIGNAVKFTEGGEVTVRAALEDTTDSRVTVRFVVSDTGIGMSEAVQARLFQAFVQADSTMTRRYGGTGLGLAITRRLVELMGGTIGVGSTEGEGSTFWFTCPFEIATAPARHQETPEFRNADDARVMIVDNHPDSRDIVHSYILSWGMRNGSASNANEALEMLRRAVAEGDPYDVAIIDLMTPEADGFDLASEILADPTLSATRLVRLAALGHQWQGGESLANGVSAYLTKPIRKSQLFDAIVNAIASDEHGRAAQVGDTVDDRHDAPEATMGDLHRSDVVLLAEDNPVNQKVARMQVERLGYCVKVVDNGRKAVEALAESDRYALVFMDVQMPEMDGFTATRAIRKAEVRSGRHIPIIAMTANAMEGDRDACIAAGMDDYLSKPVSRDKLREVLERWLPVAGKTLELDKS